MSEDYVSTAGDAGSGSVDVSVVIVSWNVRELLERCILVLLEQAAVVDNAAGIWRAEPDRRVSFTFEVLVVDSASRDGTAEMVRERFPEVKLFASSINLGYTGGNNLGIRASRGRYVFVLNPDTAVLPGAIAAMLAYAEEHHDVAVVGPQLLWPDGTIQSSRRRFPTLGSALIESTFVEKWFPNHPLVHRFRMLDEPDDIAHAVDWVVGACLLVRREAIDAVGLLDDGYFMYSEELDWQKRMGEAGWRVMYLPLAKVVHYHGRSSDQVGALTHVRFSQSKVRYFRKHHGALAGSVVWVWLMINYAYEWLVEGAKWCVGHRRDLRVQRLRIYAEVLRALIRG